MCKKYNKETFNALFLNKRAYLTLLVGTLARKEKTRIKFAEKDRRQTE